MPIEIPSQCKNTPFENVVRTLEAIEKDYGIIKISKVEYSDYTNSCIVYFRYNYSPKVREECARDRALMEYEDSTIRYNLRDKLFEVELSKVTPYEPYVKIDMIGPEIASGPYNTEITFSAGKTDACYSTSLHMYGIRSDYRTGSIALDFFKDLAEYEMEEIKEAWRTFIIP